MNGDERLKSVHGNYSSGAMTVEKELTGRGAALTPIKRRSPKHFSFRMLIDSATANCKKQLGLSGDVNKSSDERGKKCFFGA
jgi:hypothetical protein